PPLCRRTLSREKQPIEELTNMFHSRYFQMGVLAALLLSMAGCSELPGNRQQQGTVIGGASGAAVGAIAGGEKHRLLGGRLGGALGAAGGYVIGAESDKISTTNRTAAVTANN